MIFLVLVVVVLVSLIRASFKKCPCTSRRTISSKVIKHGIQYCTAISEPAEFEIVLRVSKCRDCARIFKEKRSNILF